MSSKAQMARIEIIEQPASRTIRFRYRCEGRSAGSIPGARSTPTCKTFPAIKVVGYQGKAVVVVSCVTKDIPFLAHPHNLVGREGCKRGVCTLEIPPETMRVEFVNLGIQCVKRRDIELSLRQREEIRVDPFRQGFKHRDHPTTIDLNTVRLCFQVFLEGDQKGKFNIPLRPVVSDVIYDRKVMSDLNIVKLSDCISYVDGGRKDIIILCEKIAREDIEVHFYEERDGQRVWQAKADVQPCQIHKQHAIWFRSPQYYNLETLEPVKAFIQLYRPSDGMAGEPLPFELLPLNSGAFRGKRINKRRRATIDSAEILAHLIEHNKIKTDQTLNLAAPIAQTEQPTCSTWSIPQNPGNVSSQSPAQGNLTCLPEMETGQPLNIAAPTVHTQQPTCSTWNISSNPDNATNQSPTQNNLIFFAEINTDQTLNLTSPTFQTQQPSCSTWNISSKPGNVTHQSPIQGNLIFVADIKTDQTLNLTSPTVQTQQPTCSTWNISANPENVTDQSPTQGSSILFPEIKIDQMLYLAAPTTQTQQPSCSTWNIPSNLENVTNQSPAQGNYLDLAKHAIDSSDLQKSLNDMNMSVDQLLDISSLSLTDIEPNPSLDMSDSLMNFINETANKLLK